MNTFSSEGVTVLDHPLIHVKLTEMRNAQTTPRVFRERMTELAALLLYPITSDLAMRAHTIQTPLAEFAGQMLARPVVLAPILRAALGLAEGMLRLLPEAAVAHIGLRRDERTHRPVAYYFNAPSTLPDADVIVLDPMLATGHSSAAAVAELKRFGARSLRFVCLVSCKEGIETLRSLHPDVHIYTGAIDPILNDTAYIVPGLGDAGDRYFGTVPTDL